MKSMNISKDVLTALKIPKREVEKILKIELSIALYQMSIISLGPARKLAEVNKWEFIEELGGRKIERHYTEKELDEDLVFAKDTK